MDTFLMICYVAADFGPYKGEIFRVTPDKLGIFIQAPAWIKETLMFKWLLQDGSIKIGLDKEEQKKLENDPMEGISSEGKDEGISKAAEDAEIDAGTAAIEEDPEGDPNHMDFPPDDEELDDVPAEAEEKKPEKKSAPRKSKKGEDK